MKKDKIECDAERAVTDFIKGCEDDQFLTEALKAVKERIRELTEKTPVSVG